MNKTTLYFRLQSISNMSSNVENVGETVATDSHCSRDLMSPDVNDVPLLASTPTSGVITSADARQTHPISQSSVPLPEGSQTSGASVSAQITEQLREQICDVVGEELEKSFVGIGRNIKEGLKRRRLDVSIFSIDFHFCLNF